MLERRMRQNIPMNLLQICSYDFIWVHNIWKCCILIGWLLFTIFEQFMLSHGNRRLYLAMETIPVLNDFPHTLYLLEYIFPHYFYIFLARMTSLKIIFCQHGEVWQCKHCRIYLGSVCFSFMSKMRCYVLNILFGEV